MFGFRATFRVVALAAATSLAALSAFAQNYQVTNLVANLSGNATTTDPNLIDAWGLARSATSPWWISDDVTGLSTLYDGSGDIIPLVVTIPAAVQGQTGSPTGCIYNGSTGFQLAPGAPAVFLFVTNDGTVSGWNPSVNPTTAVVVAKKPNAIYPGATIATWGGNPYLYVANVFSGGIDVYDTNFKPVAMPAGAFQIPAPANLGPAFDFDGAPGPGSTSIYNFIFSVQGQAYAPHNIQNIGGDLYIAYTYQDSAYNEVFGPGLGFVASFSPSGQFIRAFQYGPWFNSPWGLALAPSDFGTFSHNLLVGNLGSGQIAAFSLEDGSFQGLLADQNGVTFAIPGLWAISFGNGGKAGPFNTLYFTAGPNNETQGLFGSLAPLTAELTQGNDQ
jgi:uncharacterized protein (TIGR03118 family)